MDLNKSILEEALEARGVPRDQVDTDYWEGKRNYMQMKDSDVVVAVASRVKLPAHATAKMDINGGTGWAAEQFERAFW